MNKLIYVISDMPSIQFKKDIIELFPKDFKVIDMGLFTMDHEVSHEDLVREIYEKLYEHPKAFGIIIDSENVDLCKLVNKYDHLTAIDSVKDEIPDFNVICLNTFLMKFEDAKKLINVKFNL